jgi:hypothetical protein
LKLGSEVTSVVGRVVDDLCSVNECSVNECITLNALKCKRAEVINCKRAEMLKLAILFHYTVICMLGYVIILMSGEDAHHEQINVCFGGFNGA